MGMVVKEPALSFIGGSKTVSIAVRRGRFPLATSRRGIAESWIAAYERHIGGASTRRRRR